MALVYLGLAVQAYRMAKRQGQWSWSRFFIVLASAAVFTLVFILPVALWAGGGTHPGAVLSLMLGGILVYVVGLVVFLKKTASTMPPGAADKTGMPHDSS